MATFSNSPHLLKGRIMLLERDTAAVQLVMALQYKPDTFSRTVQTKGIGAETGHRGEAQRLSGPQVKTFKPGVEIKAMKGRNL